VILECVTTASTPVLVNDNPMDEFKMKRGLPQGDRLSPFFVFVSSRRLKCVDAILGEGKFIF